MPNPSIKNERMYERLREQGNSKEKAARISNAAAAQGASKVGRRGGSRPPYEEWSKQDLYDRAKDLGIEGRSGMSKGQLVEALRNH
ncbi:MAG TPA: Rho termination factor N-terminal domain-containing protein [Jiangellales bacterium]|nr:Rho termination factor N-terminal domain-containing protein [Jiangellales bacterium]